MGSSAYLGIGGCLGRGTLRRFIVSESSVGIVKGEKKVKLPQKTTTPRSLSTPRTRSSRPLS
ncbi:hypothetical protein FS749_002172, partial [Ceratobasidium sp. UAMH 11750]